MLTKEQILALPAGPAIDAAVAEHVMGRRVIIGPDAGRLVIEAGDYCHVEIPAYSTTVDGMLAVMEMVSEEGWNVEILYTSGGCRASVSRITRAYAEFIGEKPPHALSVAALLALAARGSK